MIGLMLEGKKPEEYPQASKPNEINLEGSQFVMMVAFDKLAYDKKYNAKAVKRRSRFLHGLIIWQLITILIFQICCSVP